MMELLFLCLPSVGNKPSLLCCFSLKSVLVIEVGDKFGQRNFGNSSCALEGGGLCCGKVTSVGSSLRQQRMIGEAVG